ncbi:CPBP family intramembrane metalloprotease [Enterococcus hulanensis]|nr:CPBP family intramembrane metalloprotease [Enterococcus hulanensis]
MAHGFDNVITFSMYFAMGLTLYFAYDRRKNIKDSILVHVLINGFIMMISFISYLILYFS